MFDQLLGVTEKFPTVKPRVLHLHAWFLILTGGTLKANAELQTSQNLSASMGLKQDEQWVSLSRKLWFEDESQAKLSIKISYQVNFPSIATMKKNEKLDLYPLNGDFD